MKYIRWLFIAVILLQTAVLVLLGQEKAGYHEDELYTYFSSNRTAGVAFADGEELSGEDFLGELTVHEGERFRYGMVRTVQSWDVHPPLYYDLFHTVCSLTPGVFSKWQGLVLNIAGFVLSQILLGLLAYRLTRSGLFAAAVTAVWGFSAAAASGVLFIRMYVWLTVFVLAMLLVHVSFIGGILRKKDEEHPRRFLFGHCLLFALVSFCGFLTQYYYLIALFFAGLCTVFFLAGRIRKGLPARYLVLYGLSEALSGALGLLYYPAAASHIFRGYRGREAQASFFDPANTWYRLKLFFSLTDRYTFGGILLLLLTAAAVFLAARKKKPAFSAETGLVAVTALGYFAAVAKTGLLLGESSLRYELPVCPVLVLLVLMLLKSVWMTDGRAGKALAVTAVLALLALNAAKLVRREVLFLYPENAVRAAFASDHRTDTAAVFYNEGSPDHIWWIADRLCRYDRILLIGENGSDPEADLKKLSDMLEDGEEAVLYIADAEGYPSEEALAAEGAMPEERDRMWATWLITIRKTE